MDEQNKLKLPGGGYQAAPGSVTLQVEICKEDVPNEYRALIDCVGEVHRIALTNIAIEVRSYQEHGPKLLNFRAGFYSCLERLIELLEAEKATKVQLEKQIGLSSEHRMTNERLIVRLVNESITISPKSKKTRALTHKKAAEAAGAGKLEALNYSQKVLGDYVDQTEKLLRVLQEVRTVFSEELA